MAKVTSSKVGGSGIKGIISRTFFLFIEGILKQGSRRPLQHSDTLHLGPDGDAEALATTFSKDFQETRSVFKALLRRSWPFVVLSMFWELIAGCSYFVGPLLLQPFIHLISDSDSSIWIGLLMCLGLSIGVGIGSFARSQANRLMFTVASHTNGTLLVAIYRHALHLTNASRQVKTSGEMVNLMSSDAFIMLTILPMINQIWIAPLQIIAALVLLAKLLGVGPAFAGFGMMLASFPVNALIGSRFATLGKAKHKSTDARMKLLSDVLHGIRLVKMYAWESAFIKRIDQIRLKEIGFVRRYYFNQTALGLSIGFLPISAMVVTIAVYALLGNDMRRPSTIFTALAFFDLLRLPLFMFPLLISLSVMAQVSMTRINAFLSLEAHPRRKLEINSKKYEEAAFGQAVVSIEDGEFLWKEEEEKEEATSTTQIELEPIGPSRSTLININLEVKKGELCVVVGSVGCGKSSLLSAILGDMTRKQGSLSKCGRIAYCSQKAWITNTSVQKNITLGRVFDAKRYKAVVDACALQSDFRQLAASDATEIGERGINLSGGQRQRIALARAVYSDADIFLLDDPLSAVDAHVGRHIFDHVIIGLLKGKTVILVTNQLHVVSGAGNVVVIKDGTISEIGSFDSLMSAGGEFSALMKKHAVQEEEEGGEDAISAVMSPSLKPIPAPIEELKEVVESDALLIHEEERSTGAITSSVYRSFGRAFGEPWHIILFTFLSVVSAFSRFFPTIWLAVWTGGFVPGWENTQYLVALVLIMFSSLFLNFGREMFFITLMSRAMLLMHRSLLSSVIGSPVAFFDSTPIGRLLNRFSKDFSMVEMELPQQLGGLIRSSLMLLLMMILLAVTTRWMGIVIVPILMLYYVLQWYYRCSSRELQRLEQVSRSPVYAHFNETLDGVATIRAFNVEAMSEQRNVTLANTNIRSFYTLKMAQQWFQQRLSACLAVVVLATAVTLVLTRGTVSPSVAALAIAISLGMSSLLNYFIQLLTEVEIRFTAVERVLGWTSLPQEPPSIVCDKRTPSDWPSKGRLEFKHVTLQYREGLRSALDDVSFVVKPGEKIGIVGRTGAGKSSLIVALLRTVEVKGVMLVDDVDVSEIGLGDLRSGISTIPQDPTLFTGTVRDNIDPFDQATDLEVFQALERAHLKEYVDSLPDGLNSEVAEGGANFSSGQRQLLAFARALLRKAKLILLDEATSCVDAHTDALVQQMIRTEFVDATVLTIAHRLNTVMDSDRVMVMENGRVKEFDTARRLLADPNSVLSSMVDETGVANAVHLRGLVK